MEVIFWIIIGAIAWSFIGKFRNRKIGNINPVNNSADIVPLNYRTTFPKRNFQRRKSRRFATIEKPQITLSEEINHALQLMENTSGNLFITGRAGTGKSTLLKYFRATTKKNVVALAYTGVAAVNIQGQTIHSFFHFPHDITEDKIFNRHHSNAELLKKLNSIIIDEISMVRADLFDCIDKFLRLNGPNSKKPFGGIQMIIIGDPYQLSPIVKREEAKIFEKFYKSPYFFDAKSFTPAKFNIITLSHVYRQSDQDFIKLLDAIRLCKVTNQHIIKINQRFIKNDDKEKAGSYISLVATNDMAQKINLNKLNELPGKEKVYIGIKDGNFPDPPTDEKLILKEGAQIMLLYNDPNGRWINGDVAKVIDLRDTGIRVLFEDNTFDDVGYHKWEAVRFVYDEEENKIKSEIIGSFTQLPVRLAWAVTIHKGQGKTFNRVSVDFGRGAFAAGQAYVALSRSRSFEGLMLGSPVKKDDIFVDARVNEFMEIVIKS